MRQQPTPLRIPPEDEVEDLLDYFRTELDQLLTSIIRPTAASLDANDKQVCDPSASASASEDVGAKQ